MADVSLLFQAGLEFNEGQVRDAVDRMAESVHKAKPITIQTAVGQNITADAGRAQEFLDNVQASATAVDKVRVKYETFRNTAGDTLTQLTKMTINYRDENGRAQERIHDLTVGVAALGAEWTSIEKGSGTTDIGARLRQSATEVKKTATEFDNLIKKATEWGVRAESMNTSQQKGIKAVSASLIQNVAEWKRLLSIGDSTGAGSLAKTIREQNIELDKGIAASKRAATGVRAWSDSIRNAITQTVSYTLSLGLMRGAQQLLNTAVRYTIDLNKEMTKIQVLQAQGAQTPEEIRSLAMAYNDLAREMGTTTLEIAKGSVEWLRQGKTIEETTTLMRSSTMLSKLGALDSATATEYLTSTLNSYGMAAENATSVVDKLVAVDNKSATSTAELATALRYSAASAKDAGLSLEQLISYIGVVSSTTRQNAESIGQGMKTMLTRMQDIKAGAIDEDGLGINNVEIALKRVNIPLRDTANEFRDMGGVLEDLAGKWSSLNDIEQANIAKAIAGVRQTNMFRVMMANMGTAIDLQKEQFNATGLAADRYQIYLKSVEAAQNRVTSSLESLWQSGISSGLITNILNLVSGLIELIDAFGGLNTILGLTVALIVATQGTAALGGLGVVIASIGATLNATMIPAFVKLGQALFTTNLAINATTASLITLEAMTPVGWIALAIAALALFAGGMNYASHAIERQEKALQKSTQALQESVQALRAHREEQKQALDLTAEYEELNSKQKLTTEEAQKLLDVQNKLKELFPELAGGWDDNLNFQISSKTVAQDILEIEKAKLEIIKQQNAEATKKYIQDMATLATSKQKEADALKNDIRRMKLADETSPGGASGKFDADIAKAQSQIDALNKSILALNKGASGMFNSLPDEFKPAMQEILDSGMWGKISDATKTAILNGISESTDAHDRRGGASAPKISIKTEIDDESFTREIDKVKNEVDKVNSLLLQLGQGETSSKLISDFNALGIEVELVNGKLELIPGALDAFYDKQESIINGTYDLNSAQQKLADDTIAGFSRMVYGVQMSGSAYESVANEISGSMFIAAENAKIALYDINGASLTSADSVKTAMLSNFQNFTLLVNQMVQAGIMDFSKFMSFLSSSASFASGMTPYQPSGSGIFNSGGGGGGGGGGQSAEQTRIEKIIKRLESKKKALEDELNQFNKYIEAQKLSLKLQKEEADFADKMQKKQEDLAKLRSDIMILSLDDSEEAIAQRLQMESDAADLEEEIAQDQEDRTYELQIEALDKMQQEFEDSIQAQLDALDETISKYQEQASSIQSAGGAVGGVSQATAGLGLVTAQVGRDIVDWYTKQGNLSDANKAKLQEQVNKWIEMGLTIDEISMKALAFAEILAYTNSLGNSASGGGASPTNSNNPPIPYHEGGFSGELKSNEEFAKLLKGEYIATEHDMTNFMKNILPKIANYPSVSSNNNKTGDISVSMPITVQGTLDKSVIPSIENIANTVIEKINKGMLNRGFNRRTDLYGA